MKNSTLKNPCFGCKKRNMMCHAECEEWGKYQLEYNQRDKDKSKRFQYYISNHESRRNILKDYVKETRQSPRRRNLEIEC